MHELKPVSALQGVQFCTWMLKNVHSGLVDHQLLFVTDKAYFHFKGYVNCQNTWIWSDENPWTVHQIPLYDMKIGAWCAINARWIIGPVLYHETVNSGWCVRIGTIFWTADWWKKTSWLLSTRQCYCACCTDSVSALQGVWWQNH